MALVVESVGTGTRTDTIATLTITKPASVAVGDLLITVIGWRNGVVRSLSTLSGWTSLQNSGNDSYGTGLFWRTADSADVSASDYTWSMSGNCSYMSGIMYRISGHAVGSEIAASEIDSLPGAGTSQTFTTAVTPTAATSLVIMSISGVNNVTTSTYALTPTATFTENADLALADMFFGVASAPYSGTSQITSRVFTVSSSVTVGYSVIVVINAATNASGSNALLSADADFFAPTASSGTTGTNALLSADADFFSTSGESIVPTVWTPITKS